MGSLECTGPKQVVTALPLILVGDAAQANVSLVVTSSVNTGLGQWPRFTALPVRGLSWYGWHFLQVQPRTPQ